MQSVYHSPTGRRHLPRYATAAATAHGVAQPLTRTSNPYGHTPIDLGSRRALSEGHMLYLSSTWKIGPIKERKDESKLTVFFPLVL